MNSYISISGANKKLNGIKVLDNIELSIYKGTIIGLRGHNGSGKTMLLRAIAGLIKLDSGSIFIEDKHLGSDISFPPSMGLIIENVGLWNYMSGFECLSMLAKIKGLICDREVSNVIKRVGLDPTDKRKIRKYSLGMKQRLGIAQAIMEKPDLLLLDEPTIALDNEGLSLVNDILLSEKQRGATLVVASHSEDIEDLCDNVYVMNSGSLKEKYE
ncbi:MAG: ATP-binding cassette domain-containing protein [Oscillospiraceae bacterium]|jgi:ABC-2 type transport system ATP-binding protein|nr:ATP-binding cassette domain-containing protein [Oscillospiraceae bacterium]